MSRAGKGTSTTRSDIGGELMLYVVTGPPASGKSTWVRDRAEPGDIVIDFDALALTLSPHAPDQQHSHTPAVAAVTKAARQAAIDTALRHTNSTDVYIIHSSPGARALADYHRHGANIVTIDPGEHVVLERCKRERPRAMIKVAEQWYRGHTQDPPAPAKATASTGTRGYGYRHRQLRKSIKPHVDAGEAVCWRCHHPIQPGQPWDLGHDDNDRSIWRGPEHVACNRGSAATRGNRARGTPRTSRSWL